MVDTQGTTRALVRTRPVLRSLTVTALAAALLVPLSAAPAAAATSTARLQTAPLSDSIWKNSATRRASRPPVLAPVAAAPVAAAPVAAPVVAAPVVAAPEPTYESRVLAATNVERVRAGLRPLTASSCATGYAERWAGVLAQAGALSHQSLSRVLTGCSASSVGENVAYGNVTPEQMVGMWMASPGHRANLLNASFTHLGVGALTQAGGRTYGVQVFLRL